MFDNLNSVLVPVDFSDESLRAIDVALEVAREPACVYLVHVLPELSPMEPGMVWATIDPKSRCAHAREALRKKLDAPKYRDVKMECTIGDPGHCIADEAAKIEADLIVMPSHGRRGISRLLLGSVAERVLRLAKCNVLILKIQNS